jgi:hypothetical protein
VAGFCEDGNEPSDSIKDGDFFDQLNLTKRIPLLGANQFVNNAISTRKDIKGVRRMQTVSKCSGGGRWQVLCLFRLWSGNQSDAMVSLHVAPIKPQYITLGFLCKNTTDSSRLQLAHALAPIPIQTIVIIPLDS